MDAATILEIKPTLTGFLREFDGCFGRRTTRRYLDIYVAGQVGLWCSHGSANSFDRIGARSASEGLRHESRRTLRRAFIPRLRFGLG